MDRDFFFSAGFPEALHFEHLQMPTWQPLPSAGELNCPSEQSLECFLTPTLDKSTEPYANIESALSSMVSSPGASYSAISADGFAIQELIGKLCSISNSGDVSPPSHPLMMGRLAATPYLGSGINNSNSSCYSTPLNSPPKLQLPIMNHLIKENLANLGNTAPMNPNLLALSAADPGFAERAAKFSCFGSRSFNGRTNQFGMNNIELPYTSGPLTSNAKLPRVSSSPSLKAAGSPMAAQGNKNLTQTQMEMRPTDRTDAKLTKFPGSASSGGAEFASSKEESSVSQQIPNGEAGLMIPVDSNARKRKAASKGKPRENASPQSDNGCKVADINGEPNAKRSKSTECKGVENGGVKAENDTNGSPSDSWEEKQAKTNQKPPEPPKDFIHVRARRGQATDSHSLAERVRREKISERMKLLQDLVPGCSKVTGKALMLDEIINYVQSLQRQVEFLSMKLASVNPRLDFNLDSLFTKDMFQPNVPSPHPVYPIDSAATAFFGHQTKVNQQVHANIPNGAAARCSVDPVDTTLCRNIGTQQPVIDELGQGLPRFPSFCEDDLQSLVQMGFGEQNI